MRNFDNAATTFPKPSVVYDFMDSFYRSSVGSYGRGNGGVSAGKLIADTREKLCELLHCTVKQVIFEPSATIALNVIIQGLLKKQNVKTVYISPFEHNAVTRVLHYFEEMGRITVRVLPFAKNGEAIGEIEKEFSRQKPDLVIISHASNVCGVVQSAKEIFDSAKKYGAITLLDMAQTAGLVDFDCGSETVDFAVFAAHKTLYAPTGIAGFVMKSDFDLPPVIFGGTGFESAKQDMPDDVPQRFEAGTMNISGIAGLYAAVKWVSETGVNNLFEKESEHRQRLLSLFEKYPFIRVVGNYEKKKYVGIVSVVIKNLPSDTAASVCAERNIAVRSGLQCAPLAHKTLGTFPAGTIRFSTSYFTNDEDFAELECALDYIKDNL